jgi:hypothetical protein
MTRPEYTDPQIVPHESAAERESRERLTKLLATTPIPAEYLIDNLAVYLRRCQLSDLLAMDALYRRLRAVPGVIMEFGVLHGRHLAALTALRGFYEPQNSVRRIIGFDTFTGFPDVSHVDQVSSSAVVGRFRTAGDYPDHLRDVLRAHELGEPLGHVQRSFVVQGDALDPDLALPWGESGGDSYRPRTHLVDQLGLAGDRFGLGGVVRALED